MRNRKKYYVMKQSLSSIGTISITRESFDSDVFTQKLQMAAPSSLGSSGTDTLIAESTLPESSQKLYCSKSHCRFVVIPNGKGYVLLASTDWYSSSRTRWAKLVERMVNIKGSEKTMSICKRCDVNMFSEGTTSKCLKCPEKTPVTYGKTGQEKCTDCKPGHGYDPKKQECIPCDQNSYSPGGLQPCKACPDKLPFIYDGVPRTKINSCSSCKQGDGYDPKKKSCTPCPLNTFSGGNFDQCKACRPSAPITHKTGSVYTDCKNECKPGDGYKNFEEVTRGKCKKFMSYRECQKTAQSHGMKCYAQNTFAKPFGCSFVHGAFGRKFYSYNRYNVVKPYWWGRKFFAANHPCSGSNTCVCKTTATCTKCDVNSYSPGKQSVCRECPRNTPVTYGKDGQTSPSSCKKCLPGDGYIFHTISKHRSCKPCTKNMYSQGGLFPCRKCRRNYLIDTLPAEQGENKISRTKCVKECEAGKGYVNDSGELQCRQCGANEFSPGGRKGAYYKHATCERCSGMYVSEPGSSECKKSEEAIEIERKQKEFEKQIKIIAKSVSMSEASRANLRREFASQNILADYYNLRQRRLQHDQKAKLNYCARERLAYKHTEDHSRQGIVVFPGVLLREEADNKACLYENRDRIIKSYCHFRTNFDITLKNRGFPGDSKYYWPNICCPSANGNDCKVDDTKKQSKMVPFATAQGGDGTAENLYGEIEDLLGHHRQGATRVHGYLRNGMFAVLAEVSLKFPTLNVDILEAKLDRMFESINLCGPRILDSPTYKNNVICQLFFPYKKLFTEFYDDFHRLFEAMDREMFEESSFMEMMETRKANDHSQQPMYTMMKNKQRAMQPKKVDYKRVENNLFERVQTWVKGFIKSKGSLKGEDGAESRGDIKTEAKDEITKLKKKVARVETITSAYNRNIGKESSQFVKVNDKHTDTSGKCQSDDIKEILSQKELEKVRKEFCNTQRIDVDDDPEIRNFAMVYIPKKESEGKNYDLYMEFLATHAVFNIRDKCPSAMFKASDVMMQQVYAPDKNGTEWVFLIALDTESENGYLSSEMSKCFIAENLPRTELNIQVYVDKEMCCGGIKDYGKCLAERRGCRDKIKALDTSVWNSWKQKPFAFKMTVTGTIFKWELSDFILDGTLHTKLSAKNYLNILGGDVNSGLEKQDETVLLQIGVEDKKSLNNKFIEFFENLDKSARCAGASAEQIFSAVKVSQKKGQDFEFSCQAGNAKRTELCNCLSQISRDREAIIFKSSNGFVHLNGNVDKGVQFEITDSKGGRRKLLQQSRRFC